MTTKVVKGSLWTLAGQVAPLGVSLFTTPFVIRMLGAESYGVLILVVLIPTYLGFADFGMSMASTKFASEAYATGDLEKEARIVRTAAVIALCSSLPFGIALFALSGWLVTLFNVPENLQPEAAIALKIASVTFVVNFLNLIFNTPQLSRLRMDLNTFVTSGARILALVATPIVIYLGGGILGAVIVLFISAVLTLAGHLYCATHLLPQLFGSSLNSAMIRPFLSFGGPLTLSGIVGLLLANIEKGILPSMASVKELAYYSVAFTIASMLTLFSAAMSQALLPAFARLHSGDDTKRLAALFSRAVKINLIWLVPVLTLLSVGAQSLLMLWAGEELARNSLVPFYILLVGLIFHVLTYLPYTLIMAVGQTGLLARVYTFELVPYIFLAFFLIQAFGAVGAAAAWSIRIVVDCIVLLAIARKVSGVSIPFHVVGKVMWAAPVMLIPILVSQVYGRLTIVIVGTSLLCFCVYSYLIWRIVLDEEETLWLVNRLNAHLPRPIL